MYNNIPIKYRPLSAWEYFGLTIVFNIPILGFIILIIMALGSSNINRRNFARSFFCIYIVIAILIILFLCWGYSLPWPTKVASPNNYF